ncbi:MAG: DUF819 family protein [Candidatus Wallbacteria bacterium]|nr:DUF819 family protein [Candidatus Wallbacteria bacterium]
MITNGFTYLAVILFLAAVIVQLDKRYQSFFKNVPGIVMLYFIVMLCSSMGLWQKSQEVTLYYSLLKNNLLPVMIFLMLLRCDLRQIAKLGPRMILGFFSATLSICLGFIVTYALLKSFYPPDTWKAFAALCGSWIGGTGNMVAVQGALGVTDSQMGYTLLIDSIDYAIWVMLLLSFVPFAGTFNKWTGADTAMIDEIGGRLASGRNASDEKMEFQHLILLVGVSFFVAASSQNLAAFLPTSSFISTSTWAVIIVTVAGTACAMTPLGQIPGTSQMASLLLYAIVGLIGSRANFAELTQAPLYIFSGFMILAIHAAILALIARLFRLDLFTCGVASLANIGGVASAPILAAAYSEVLIPIGVLMGLMGYVVGTGGGLLVGKILSII